MEGNTYIRPVTVQLPGSIAIELHDRRPELSGCNARINNLSYRASITHGEFY